MARTVGKQERNEFILDPDQALRRGRVLDRMLAGALPAAGRGVLRARHCVFNELDDQRRLHAARRLNAR